jgi:hypothetical protein
MDVFFPFIHKIEKKKKEFEPEPLYVELYPPPPVQKEKEETDETGSTVIIIEL